MKTILIFLCLSIGLISFGQLNVEKWKVYEISLKGPSDGNPYTDVQLSAVFTHASESNTVNGFYCGNGIYKVRFMPSKEGEWKYITASGIEKLNGIKDKFICTPPAIDNHGPVMVSDTFYFKYADGTPHYSAGTTIYNLFHQGDSLNNFTFETLSRGYFNKVRMNIFFEYFRWSGKDPLIFPYEKKADNSWDFTRFNPGYFQIIDNRIRQLDSLGIEADIIVFNYTNLGFKNMGRDMDDLYIKYLIARYSAFKNVWWSMANEFDLLEEKSMEDWHHIVEMFARYDPYHRLRSIHNGFIMYDHTNPLITHLSVQSSNTEQARDLRKKYNKPVIYDECQYEGNTDEGWGNITGQEMVNRFWKATVNGGFAGHGEMYLNIKPVTTNDDRNEVLWVFQGGVLDGTSPKRIKFLREIVEAAPGQLKLKPKFFGRWFQNYSAIGYEDMYFLTYFNMTQPSFMVIDLPKEKEYKVEIIDTWNMEITPLEGTFSGKCLINLPERIMTAIRITQIIGN